jgi:hypothetical protein
MYFLKIIFFGRTPFLDKYITSLMPDAKNVKIVHICFSPWLVEKSAFLQRQVLINAA